MKNTQVAVNQAQAPVGVANKSINIVSREGKDLGSQRQRDSEMVRGRFRYFEVPNGTMSFSYKCYKGDDVVRYDFIDGEIYNIPYGVAKHLNKDCWYPEYGYIGAQNNSGQSLLGSGTVGAFNNLANQGMRMCRKIQRMGFESLEFFDLEDVAPMASPIITIENA